MKPLRVLCILSALISAAILTVPAGGQIAFAPAVSYNPGPASFSVAVADLRRSGKLDLVVTNYCETVNQSGNCAGEEGGVSVLLGNGDGTFQPAVMYATGAPFAASVAVGDVNGDGVPDLVVADVWQTFHQFGGFFPGGVSVLLGNGDGTFQPPVVYGSDGVSAYSVALADLRNNGKLDIIVTHTYDDETTVVGSVSVLLGNGDGTFQPAADYDSGGAVAASLAIGDVNGDGIRDLVVQNYCQDNCGNRHGGAGVLLGNGDGTFQPAVVYDSGGNFADSVALADLRGNGILDVVVANRTTDGLGGWKHSNVGVLLGNGNGTFQTAVTYPVGGVSGIPFPAIGDGFNGIAVTDLSGDGVPDVAVVRWCTHIDLHDNCFGNKDVSVLVGKGNGTFQPASVYSSGGFLGSVLAVADVNGDGRPDLIVVNEVASELNFQTGSVAVLLNKTTYKTTTVLTSSPNPSQVNQTVTLRATVSSSLAVPNGEFVTFYAGSTKLGKAAISKGVATLTTSFSKANTYTLKAKYSGDTWHKPSSGIVSQVVNP
jgi:hypothetical protein